MENRRPVVVFDSQGSFMDLVDPIIGFHINFISSHDRETAWQSATNATKQSYLFESHDGIISTLECFCAILLSFIWLQVSNDAQMMWYQHISHGCFELETKKVQKYQQKSPINKLLYNTIKYSYTIIFIANFLSSRLKDTQQFQANNNNNKSNIEIGNKNKTEGRAHFVFIARKLFSVLQTLHTVVNYFFVLF